MSTHLPLVSIVTPSFNQARFLEATLDSILNQNHPRLETIAVDGGSTDGSLDILHRYEGRQNRWLSEPGRGQADAINKGLRLARGEIVAWLNSDDLRLPGAIGQAGQTLAEHPETGMVYGDGVLINEDDVTLDRRTQASEVRCEGKCSVRQWTPRRDLGRRSGSATRSPRGAG